MEKINLSIPINDLKDLLRCEFTCLNNADKIGCDYCEGDYSYVYSESEFCKTLTMLSNNYSVK